MATPKIQSLPTERAVSQLYKSFANLAEEAVQEHGSVASQIFLVDFDSDNGSLNAISRLENDSVSDFLESDAGRRAFSNFVATVLDSSSDYHLRMLKEREFRANGVVVVAEVFYQTADSNEELEEAIAHQGPEGEAIMVGLHTERGYNNGFSCIERNANGGISMIKRGEFETKTLSPENSLGCQAEANEVLNRIRQIGKM